MLRNLYQKVLRSMKGPVTIPASFVGIQERNEWIRNNRILKALEDVDRGKNPLEEIIRILGSDYDSLEALLSVTIPTADDRLTGTVEKDNIVYRTTAELTLVSRFLAEGKQAYQYGRLLLSALRSEKERRNQEDYLGRSQGFCCSTRSVRSEGNCGCEKPPPETWEIGRSVI